MRPLGAWFARFVHAADLSRGAARSGLTTIFFVGFAAQGAVATLLSATMSLAVDRSFGRMQLGTQVGPLDLVDVVTIVVSVAHACIAAMAAVYGVSTVRSMARRVRVDAHVLAVDGSSGVAPIDDATPRGRAARRTERTERTEFEVASVRSAALGAVMSFAVLGATPLWFAAFAVLTGASSPVLAVLALLTMSTYAGGVVQAATLARIVTSFALPSDVSRSPSPDDVNSRTLPPTA